MVEEGSPNLPDFRNISTTTRLSYTLDYIVTVWSSKEDIFILHKNVSTCLMMMSLDTITWLQSWLEPWQNGTFVRLVIKDVEMTWHMCVITRVATVWRALYAYLQVLGFRATNVTQIRSASCFENHKKFMMGSRKNKKRPYANRKETAVRAVIP
jgi:hypothetical protein